MTQPSNPNRYISDSYGPAAERIQSFVAGVREYENEELVPIDLAVVPLADPLEVSLQAQYDTIAVGRVVNRGHEEGDIDLGFVARLENSPFGCNDLSLYINYLSLSVGPQVVRDLNDYDQFRQICLAQGLILKTFDFEERDCLEDLSGAIGGEQETMPRARLAAAVLRIAIQAMATMDAGELDRWAART